MIEYISSGKVGWPMDRAYQENVSVSGVSVRK